MSGSDQPDRAARRCGAQPENWCWISAVVLMPVVVLTGSAALVLIVTTHPTEASAKIEPVKTALSVGACTGGVMVLVLAGRRQWHAENDATERGITELYGKAVEQLGSGKAAVSLDGLLYAFGRRTIQAVDIAKRGPHLSRRAYTQQQLKLRG